MAKAIAIIYLKEQGGGGRSFMYPTEIEPLLNYLETHKSVKVEIQLLSEDKNE